MSCPLQDSLVCAKILSHTCKAQGCINKRCLDFAEHLVQPTQLSACIEAKAVVSVLFGAWLRGLSEATTTAAGAWKMMLELYRPQSFLFDDLFRSKCFGQIVWSPGTHARPLKSALRPLERHATGGELASSTFEAMREAAAKTEGTCLDRVSM